MMDELLKKLSAKGKVNVTEDEAKAKLDVIKELLEMAQSAMADGVKSDMDSLISPKEAAAVKVTAPDEESLAEGLDVAKDMISPEGEDSEEESESPALEALEDATGEDELEGEDEEDKKKSKKYFPGLL